MTVSQQQQQEQEPRALLTPSAPSSSSTTTTANQASPWKRPQLAKRTGGSQPLPAPKAPRNDYYQQERQVQHRRSSRDMTQPVRIHPLRNKGVSNKAIDIYIENKYRSFSSSWTDHQERISVTLARDIIPVCRGTRWHQASLS